MEETSPNSAEETVLFLFVFSIFCWGYKWRCNNVHFLQLFFCRRSEIDHEHDGFNCDAHRRFEEWPVKPVRIGVNLGVNPLENWSVNKTMLVWLQKWCFIFCSLLRGRTLRLNFYVLYSIAWKFKHHLAEYIAIYFLKHCLSAMFKMSMSCWRWNKFDATPSCQVAWSFVHISCLFVCSLSLLLQCMYLLSEWIDLYNSIYSKYINSWISIHIYIYISRYINMIIHYQIAKSYIYISIHIYNIIQCSFLFREIIIWICRPRKRWSCKKSGKGRNGRLQSFVWEP